MTLVNVVPQVVPNPKTHVSGLGNFLGRSNGLPAPCATNDPMPSKKNNKQTSMTIDRFICNKDIFKLYDNKYLTFSYSSV